MKKIFSILAASLLIWMSGCVKQDFDIPPISNLPVGEIYTIEQLRTMYADSGEYTFDFDASAYAIVTMDESSGNIYKAAYIQDKTSAAELYLDQSGGLVQGDSIRVYLKGVTLSDYNGLFQLAGVNSDSNIVILKNKLNVEPKTVTIADIQTGNYQCQLIKLDSVEFASSVLGKTYSEASAATNRSLEDCDGNTIDVRTSNYATFFDELLPTGKGSLIAIAGVYGTSFQLTLRTSTEVDLTGTRCDGGGGGGGVITPVDEVNEQFNDVVDYENVDITGWMNIVVAGDRLWQGKTFNTDKYIQATGYNSGLDDMETWIITPPVINTSSDKKLSFSSAMAYWAHSANQPLTVWAATDYDGTNATTANWTELTVTLATSSNANYEWVPSGEVDLSGFTGNVAVAFRYKGSATESTSFQLDNVVISGNGGGGGGGTDPVAEVNEPFDGVEDYTDVSIDGWQNVIFAGDRKWQGKTYNTEKYIQATGYNSGLDDMETWIVTPRVINTTGEAKLSFSSAQAYWAHSTNAPLTVYASTDYDGTDVEGATWTELSVVTAGSGDANYAWVESGDVSLSSFVGNVAIAFRYKGSSTESTSIQLDNVVITSGGGGGGGGTTSLNEAFTTDLGTFSSYNESGTQVWEWASYDDGCAKMTGYASGAYANIDWLISPALDLSNNSGTVLTVRQTVGYINGNWQDIQILVSSNYSGSGDPNSATWTEVTAPNMPSGSDFTFVDSGNIDLSSFDGQASVYVAFKYVSTTANASTWEISSVTVQ